MTDYQRIEKAILFLKEHFRDQPDLDEVARQVHLSPFHFQRLFKEWAGVSPKKFLQFISVEYAKGLLKQNLSLSDASFETGLSGTGRLHDLFINIEGMTPGEFKSGGEDLHINYSFAETLFGDVLIASTEKGICYLSFVNEKNLDSERLVSLFPKASFQQKTDLVQQNALQFFTGDWTDLKQIKLHLKGTPFQLKVWQSLLKIPLGKVLTYGSIAGSIESPNASRAVGRPSVLILLLFLFPVTASSGLQVSWAIITGAPVASWPS